MLNETRIHQDLVWQKVSGFNFMHGFGHDIVSEGVKL